MNFRSVLVSKVGSLLVFGVSAGLSALLAFFAAKFPSLHFEKLVEALGGQLVVTLLLMGLLREALAWCVRHWAHTNIEAVKVVQEAINAELGTAALKTDGLLQQKTGVELNKLFKGDIPIEKLPTPKKPDKATVALLLAIGVLAAAVFFSSCAGDGGAHVKVAVPIPIPPEQPEKQWRIVLDIGIFPPADFTLPFVDAPIALPLADPIRLGLSKND